MDDEPIGNGIEPHGAGSEELPDVITPEAFVDRYTHQSAYNAIMMIEAALINSKPTPSVDGSFVAASFTAILNGTVSNIVKQQYLDKGWINVSITAVNATTSSIKLYFP